VDGARDGTSGAAEAMCAVLDALAPDEVAAPDVGRLSALVREQARRAAA
jgi:hypothetical protein